jgi:hypothetical protein
MMIPDPLMLTNELKLLQSKRLAVLYIIAIDKWHLALPFQGYLDLVWQVKSQSP